MQDSENFFPLHKPRQPSLKQIDDPLHTHVSATSACEQTHSPVHRPSCSSHPLFSPQSAGGHTHQGWSGDPRTASIKQQRTGKASPQIGP